MLEKSLLEFDDAFTDGCIVGNHGLSADEIEKLTVQTAIFIADLKKKKEPYPAQG